MTELSVEMVQLVTLHTIFARHFQEFGQLKIIELPTSRQTLDGQRVELMGDGAVQGLL
jgi:hypothetical protein